MWKDSPAPLTPAFPSVTPLRFHRTNHSAPRLTFLRRPLGSLTEFFPWLDTKRTDGDMSASLVLSGTPGDIDILGSTDLNAKSLAASNVATALQKVKLNGRFDGTKVSINGEATGSEGGSIQIDNVGLSFDNLSDIIGKSFDEIYRNQLFGSLKLNDLKATYMDPKEGPLTKL